MHQNPIRIELHPSYFSDRERPLVQSDSLSASLFRYDSGVCAVRLRNGAGELVMLPFQGQQIWSAHLGGRELTMVSMFDQPRPTQAYVETYGGFLLHCGMTAMGVPGPEDNHPVHGELPNAPFQRAYLLVGEDEEGSYIGMGGQYQHTVAFTTNYVAEPVVKLRAGASLIQTDLAVTNLMQAPMELMYLAHINFRPVDNSRLIYSAHCTPVHVRVRLSIPAHIRPAEAYSQFIEELVRNPARHHHLTSDLSFAPEVVFGIDYEADAEGWAHSLQLHPDGNADYVRHRPQQLNVGVRWISRTGDQDAMGLVLPATAEPEGYTAEKAKGYLRQLPPKGVFRCSYEMGALNPAQATEMAHRIDQILAANPDQ